MRMLLKSKSSQNIFGMSFGMIFSIILIVFFVVVAFIAIRAFLSWQKCSQIGLFYSDLENEVKTAINSDGMSRWFNRSLPSGIDYVCFVNLSSSSYYGSVSNIEKSIWDYAKENEQIVYSNNVYLYSEDKEVCNGKFKWKNIKNIDFSVKNPNCVKVKNGKASIFVERKFDFPVVYLSG